VALIDDQSIAIAAVRAASATAVAAKSVVDNRVL
jgi:hypothetical protein